MANVERPLAGVKVVEMATMVAAPAAARFLADMGADVVKVESAKGDMLRFGAGNEGRPMDHAENMTFDLENANKRGIILDLRADAGKEVLFKLLEQADVFITNWRPQALVRQGLDYETLRERFPRLVYGLLSGYGEKGPDCNLPGFDATAFFARGGWSGTLYQKGTVPPNWTPGLGDHQAGITLAAGILAALYRARQAGVGEKVSVNLLHTSIYMQSLMLQAAQYGSEFGGQAYPLDRRTHPNPFFSCARTSDGRFIQMGGAVYDAMYPKIMTALDREDLLDDPVLGHIAALHEAGRTQEMYDFFQAEVAKRPAAHWVERFTAVDIAFSVCQTWEEVLEDPQAWAIDCFYTMDYPRGPKALVRTPVDLAATPLPPYGKAPLMGQHTEDVLAALGYTPEQMAALEEAGAATQYEG